MDTHGSLWRAPRLRHRVRDSLHHVGQSKLALRYAIRLCRMTDPLDGACRKVMRARETWMRCDLRHYADPDVRSEVIGDAMGLRHERTSGA